MSNNVNKNVEKNVYFLFVQCLFFHSGNNNQQSGNGNMSQQKEKENVKMF